MRLLLDSFWRAVAYCLHPRVIVLSVAPLILMAVLAAGLGYFYWDPAVAWMREALDAWPILSSLWGWIERAGASDVKAVLAPLAVWLIASFSPPGAFSQVPQLWWLIPGLGLLGTLAFAAMMASSRLLPMGLFGILSYVEPVLLFAVAVAFLGEPFNPDQLWTYLPIWLAVLLIGGDSAVLLRRQARKGF